MSRHYQKTRPLIALTLAALCWNAAGQAHAEESQVIATINGDAITADEVRTFFRRQGPASGLDVRDPQAQTQLFKLLIEREILYQEGIKKGIDKQPEVALAIEDQRRQEIAKAVIEHHLKEHPITEEQVKALYEKEYGPDRAFEVKLRHIQLDSEEEAKKVIERLEKGESFEALARELSKDASAEKGGDLGWHSLNALPAGFGEVIVTLDEAQFSKQPIQSDLGWHVVMVEKKRPVTPPSYESIKHQLFDQLQNQAIADYIARVKEQAEVTINQQ